MTDKLTSNQPLTVIVGATNNTARYAYMAAERLTQSKIDFVALGIKKGEVFGHKILNIAEKPQIGDVDTITLYVGARNLAGYEDYILSLSPRRIIFNPGSENFKLEEMAINAHIEVVHGCTLVMLGSRTY